MAVEVLLTTKVGDLLEAYPELEEILIAMVPAFQKLRNPVLRRTVARVATLKQAAQIGKLDPPALVAALRDAVGQQPVAVQPGPEPASPAPTSHDWRPESEMQIIETFDADAMLEAGEHPLGRVTSRLQRAAPGEAIRILSSFEPVPLIEQMRSRGFRVESSQREPGMFATLVAKDR